MSARFHAFSYEDLLCLVQEYLRRLLHYFGQCFAQTSGITVLLKTFQEGSFDFAYSKMCKTGPLAQLPLRYPLARTCTWYIALKCRSSFKAMSFSTTMGLKYTLKKFDSPTLRCILQLWICGLQWVFFNGVKRSN